MRKNLGSFSHGRVAAACALALLPLASPPAGAVQLSANWVGAASGQYGAAGNWDIGRVPLNGSDSFIAYVAPGKTILYGVAGANRLDSLLLDAGASISLSSPSLILPNSLTVLGRALFGGSVSADTTALTALGAGSDFIGNANTASAVNGAVVKIAATKFDASGLVNRTILNAAAAKSELLLSSVQVLDSGFADGRGLTNTVSASNGGVIDLSAAARLIAPVSGNDVLTLSATSGANIRLASLQDVAGVTLDTGWTRFTVDGASIDLGPLQRANRVQVGLANASKMSVGGYAGVASITNSTFAAASGSTLDGSTLIADYAATGIGVNLTLMSANGQGSLLDLSRLRSINSAFSDGRGVANSVAAGSGGVVDLSAVTRLIAPVSGNDALAFSAARGGSIRLASLQDVAGFTLDSGWTRFSADGGSIVLGPLQRANRIQVSLANASTMRVGGYAGVADITNSTFSVGSGSTLDGSTLTADYAATGIGINLTLMGASGQGSVLNLSKLQSINSAFSDGRGVANTVAASNGGVIDISGVRTLVTPTSRNDALTFSAASGGSIQLGALQAPVTLNRGQLNFNVATAGSIRLGGFVADTGVHFNVVDAASRIAVDGDLALLAGSTVAAGKGSELQFTGDLSFAQTVASQVATDLALVSFVGSGLQTLEVGGAQLGALADGAIATNNFAIGRLTVGGSGAINQLELADAINNGHRGTGGREALYLNGVDGVGGAQSGNGLRILGGSTLVLDGIDLYTTESGAWLHVNTLFAPGVNRIAYDQGWIALDISGVPAVPEPERWSLMLCGVAALGMLSRRRRAQPGAQ